jgi:hypothetical protein
LSTDDDRIEKKCKEYIFDCAERRCDMLSVGQIQTTVTMVAAHYPIKSVRLFGSYAEGRETEDSDVDVLVEFSRDPISLLKFFGFQEELAEHLGTSVDVVKYPLSEETRNTLTIDRMVTLYGE